MSCLVYKFAPCLDRLSFILVAFLRRVMHLGKSAFIKFVFIQNQRKLPTQKRQSSTIFLFFVPVLENWSDTNHLCINNSRRNTTHSSLNENRAANVVNHHENLHSLNCTEVVQQVTLNKCFTDSARLEYYDFGET